MFDIRIAVSSDAPELHKLNDLFNGVGSSTVESVAKSITSNEQEIVCVAARGNELVGFCCGQVLKSMCYCNKYGEITELFVMEEFRRQGLGKKLLAFTENELARRGARHLHILTSEKNTTAQALYRSCGYRNTTEILLDKDIAGAG